MKKFLFPFAASILLTVLFYGCNNSQKTFTRLDDLKKASIGAMTGSTGEELVKQRFPEARVKSFDDIMDAIAALKSNQVDAVITGYPTAVNTCKYNTDLVTLSEPVNHENTCIAISKGNTELLDSLNAFLTQLQNDGTLKDMKRRWFKKDLLPYETVKLNVPSSGKPLKIGTSATREPFAFVDAENNITGHDGELARRIGVRFGRPVEFVNMKFGALIPALKSGKIDMIVTGMTATPERSKSVDFTKSYFENSQVMIVKSAVINKPAEDNINMSPGDRLKNKRIGVLAGSTHDIYARQNFPNSEILQYKSAADIMLAVKARKVDAAIYITQTLQDMTRKDNSLAIFGDTLYSNEVGMGFNKKSSVLRESFNEFLNKIKKDSTYDDIIKRWITEGNTEMPRIVNIKNNGVLKVGIVGDKGLPFCVVVNNKYVGLDIEFAERFAAYIGRELELYPMDFSGLIAAAASGKIDMISCTMVITEERKKQIDFSEPYLKLGASLFGLKNNNIIPSDGKMKVLSDVADKTIGVYAGTVHDKFVEDHYPKADIKRFNTPADIILSLKSGKVDVAFMDYNSAVVILKSNPDIGILSDEALTLDVGFGFSKNNPALREEFNRYLKEIRSNGMYDSAYKRWIIEDAEKAKMPPFKTYADGKQVNLAVAVGDLPSSAVANGEYVGFDIELLKGFAEKNKYNLKISTMEFSALIAALSAGKADIIADGICITEERKQRVDFSDSYNSMKTAVLVLNKNLAASVIAGVPGAGAKPVPEKSFFQGVKDSFYSNIILENRYLLIIDGLKVTGIISVLSILFGTVLGGLVCFMRMSGRKILQVPAKIYISILRGTPVLVVLMIIFYVVFASVDIDPVLVAVFAFGLNFAAYTSEMFRTGIEGVDKGQTEAGIAIGFTKVKTFIYIILPQAVRRILPVYKGEVISLVKMTSIVGYIAVQDLTKASDIIRSRTFDAFFPLIMVAVLYFIISWLLMVLLGYIERRSNSKIISAPEIS